jgi:hypothetical protein
MTTYLNSRCNLVCRKEWGNIHVEVLWVVTPCSVAVGYRSFTGPWCLHFQGDFTRNVCILPHHFTLKMEAARPPKCCYPTILLNPEDDGSEVLQNVGILPHQFTLKIEATKSSETLMSHHYTASQPRRARCESLPL